MHTSIVFTFLVSLILNNILEPETKLILHFDPRYKVSLLYIQTSQSVFIINA